MSRLVARMQKYKVGNLGGIERHHERKFKNHSNDCIEHERTNLNYDLVNREANYQKTVEAIILSERQSSGSVRKDAVLVNEWVVTSDTSFFKDMTIDERKNFFEESLKWFKSEYGEKNVAYAKVHWDETTPHMHLGIVPITKDGKLSSKEVFNRKSLLTVQKDLPMY